MEAETKPGYYAEFVHGTEMRMVLFRTKQTDLSALKQSAVRTLTSVYGTRAAQKYVLDLLYPRGKKDFPVYRRNKVLIPDRAPGCASTTGNVSKQTRRERISEILRDRIKNGDYKPDQQMPSHNKIAHELEVSSRTVGLAVADLCKQGYLTVAAGKGTCPLPKEKWKEQGQ